MCKRIFTNSEWGLLSNSISLSQKVCYLKGLSDELRQTLTELRSVLLTLFGVRGSEGKESMTQTLETGGLFINQFLDQFFKHTTKGNPIR